MLLRTSLSSLAAFVHCCCRWWYASCASPCQVATSGAAWRSRSASFSVSEETPPARSSIVDCICPKWTFRKFESGTYVTLSIRIGRPDSDARQRRGAALVVEPCGGVGVDRRVVLAAGADQARRLREQVVDVRLVLRPRLHRRLEAHGALPGPSALQFADAALQPVQRRHQVAVDRLEVLGGLLHQGVVGLCLVRCHARHPVSLVLCAHIGRTRAPPRRLASATVAGLRESGSPGSGPPGHFRRPIPDPARRITARRRAPGRPPDPVPVPAAAGPRRRRAAAVAAPRRTPASPAHPSTRPGTRRPGRSPDTGCRSWRPVTVPPAPPHPGPARRAPGRRAPRTSATGNR